MKHGLIRSVQRSARNVALSMAFVMGSVAGMGTTPSAMAQTSGSRPENPEVEKLVARGIELRNEGHDAQALKAFEKAAEIDPDSVRVQLHLATTYQALGNWLRADEFLSMALRHENHPYVVRHRKALEEAQRVINANIGRLEVDGEPAGAEVRLNGRLMGTLPLAAPVRATVGQYMLEVRLDGHYTARRPIVITGRGLVRESVRLEALSAEDRERRGSNALAAPGMSSMPVEEDSPAARPWLTWTLAGLSAASAATTVTALVFREIHAGRWNDNGRCLAMGQTREELCGPERDKAQTAETVALASGVATGAFAVGALLNAVLWQENYEPEPAAAGLQGCAVGAAGVSCFGAF